MHAVHTHTHLCMLYTHTHLCMLYTHTHLCMLYTHIHLHIYIWCYLLLHSLFFFSLFVFRFRRFIYCLGNFFVSTECLVLCNALFVLIYIFSYT
eukprot:GHVQ01039903.1.p2 GENE.GHVQ01039903.1~~GHVQ01039903.1.p2  ORF type:complete len:105 (+),score=4.40 GHVQ01039903.1:36-317(+)